MQKVQCLQDVRPAAVLVVIGYGGKLNSRAVAVF
jgi:hypothetical protein